RLDVLAAHGHPAVLVPEQVLQQDLHGVGEVGQVEVATEPRQAGVGVGPPVDLQAVAGGERIGHGGGSWWGKVWRARWPSLRAPVHGERGRRSSMRPWVCNARYV